LSTMAEYKGEGKILTGLLYMDSDSQDLHENISSTKKPLRGLTEEELCPGSSVLGNINESLR